jgi:hypothetical protein
VTIPFLRALEAQRNPPKILRSHRRLPQFLVAENHHPRAKSTIAPQSANAIIDANSAHRIEINRA